jgi:serine/threonine protein kinase
MSPPSPHASYVNKITNRGDQILARLALRREFVTQEQVEHGLELQQQLKTQGQDFSLGQVLHKRGLLTERQVTALEMVTQKALSQLASGKAEQAPKATAAAPGATAHLTTATINRMRDQMAPTEFKQYLLDTFLECALKTSRLKENDPTPDPFGPYKSLSLLGQGGMALVYKVYDPEQNQDVAIKVMRPELAGDKEYVLRFLREASNTAFINHTNVVRFYSFGAVAGRLYFTLELIEGKTLKQRMAEGRLPKRQGLEILRQVMEGLIAAHEQGIGHRDLKPANIMITTNASQFGFDLHGESNTVVKVTDFGLARMYGNEVEGTITQEGQFLGTAKYIAPELIKGEDATLQSDIFSLGIMAFQMFSAIPPFRVKQKVDYIEANLRWEAPLIHEVAPEIAPGISIVVDAMLEKDPMDRPTADSLLRDIVRLENMGIADDPGPVDDITSVFHPSRKLIKERRKNRGQASKGIDPRIYIALGVAGFLLFALFLLLIFKRPSSNPDVTPPLGKDPITNPGGGGTGDPDPGADLVISKLDGFSDVLKPPLSSFGGQVEKLAQFRVWVKQGDKAFREKKLTLALTAWEKANSYVQVPALKQRIEAAGSQAVMADIQNRASNGLWENVVSLCHSAINRGQGNTKINEILARAKKIVQKQIEFKKALRQIGEFEKQGELKEALKTLDNAERSYLLPNPELIDPDGILKKLKQSLRAQVKQKQKKAQAIRYITNARIFMLDQSWDLSEQALKDARSFDSGAPEIRKLERYLAAGRETPKGYVFMPPALVDIFGEKTKVNAMYVPKEPISNKAYLDYLKGPGKGQRRPRSWKGGQYPSDLSDQPVLLVTEIEANRYGESLKGRLPDRSERTRLDRFLKLSKHRVNRPNSKKELEDGFRIVIPLRDLP